MKDFFVLTPQWGSQDFQNLPGYFYDITTSVCFVIGLVSRKCNTNISLYGRNVDRFISTAGENKRCITKLDTVKRCVSAGNVFFWKNVACDLDL